MLKGYSVDIDVQNSKLNLLNRRINAVMQIQEIPVPLTFYWFVVYVHATSFTILLNVTSMEFIIAVWYNTTREKKSNNRSYGPEFGIDIVR